MSVNQTENINNIKNAYQAPYKRMVMRYGALLGSDARDLGALFKYHVEEMGKGGVEPDYIEQIYEELTNLHAYKNYPPKPQDFVAHYRKIKSNEASSRGVLSYEQSLEKELGIVYKKLGMHYGALWDKESTDGTSERFLFWLEEIKESGIEASSILLAYKKIRRMGEFRNYPPNVDQFIDTARISALNEDIPYPEDAYRMASQSSSVEIHPLVRMARHKHGAFELRMAYGTRAKDSFINIYRQIIIDYLNGDIVIDSTENEPQAPECQNQVDKDGLLSLLGDLINKCK